jgi:hypothetical protein
LLLLSFLSENSYVAYVVLNRQIHHLPICAPAPLSTGTNYLVVNYSITLKIILQISKN